MESNRPSLKLIGFEKAINKINFIRDLTAEEEGLSERYIAIISEVRSRLSLFSMLVTNFNQWSSFVSKLQVSGNQDYGRNLTELNRLFLNYVTFAYSIREHFEVSYRRRFRRDPRKMEEYNDFIDRLGRECWSFAFITDYRNHVQHRGLAIGKYTHSIGDSQNQVEILAESEKLTQQSNSREWKNSKLTPTYGAIDLVKALEEFHNQMIGNFVQFVVRCFYPDLLPASKFYAELTAEVKDTIPTAIMILHKGEPHISVKNGFQVLELNAILAPNDVFQELGIHIAQKDSHVSTQTAPDTIGGHDLRTKH